MGIILLCSLFPGRGRDKILSWYILMGHYKIWGHSPLTQNFKFPWQERWKMLGWHVAKWAAEISVFFVSRVVLGIGLKIKIDHWFTVSVDWLDRIGGSECDQYHHTSHHLNICDLLFAAQFQANYLRKHIRNSEMIMILSVMNDDVSRISKIQASDINFKCHIVPHISKICKY